MSFARLVNLVRVSSTASGAAMRRGYQTKTKSSFMRKNCQGCSKSGPENFQGWSKTGPKLQDQDNRGTLLLFVGYVASFGVLCAGLPFSMAQYERRQIELRKADPLTRAQYSHRPCPQIDVLPGKVQCNVKTELLGQLCDNVVSAKNILHDVKIQERKKLFKIQRQRPRLKYAQIYCRVVNLADFLDHYQNAHFLHLVYKYYVDTFWP